jgi:hypothetical protein
VCDQKDFGVGRLDGEYWRSGKTMNAEWDRGHRCKDEVVAWIKMSNLLVKSEKYGISLIA